MSNVERMRKSERWSEHSAFSSLAYHVEALARADAFGFICHFGVRLPRCSPATTGRRRLLRHLLSILRFMRHVSFYATRDLPWQLRSDHERSSRCDRACSKIVRRSRSGCGAQRRETTSFFTEGSPRFAARDSG